MKCAGHVDLDAVGTCNICGKGLCPECASTFTPPLCGGCALTHNKGVAKSFWFQLALMSGLFVIALIVLSDKVQANGKSLWPRATCTKMQRHCGIAPC
jgi:hypothetical protein